MTPAGTPNEDLIDRIAKDLPVEVRGDYYREMMHCRTLPENDEMLRVLRIMQFLTLLMVKTPARVVIEREKLEKIFATSCQELDRLFKSSEAHREQLDERLIQLPEAIATGISPEAIAGRINESLHQKFLRSTIPETAQTLGILTDDMREYTSEFKMAANALGNSYRGTVEQARKAIAEMEGAISKAGETAKRATEELLRTFHKEYRQALILFSISALFMGFMFGVTFERWRISRVSEPMKISTPATQNDVPSKPKNSK